MSNEFVSSGTEDVPDEGAVLTKQEVADTFKVSTKTVDRWRERFDIPSTPSSSGGSVTFLHSDIQQFVQANAKVVHRASNFSIVNPEERGDIQMRAENLRDSGLNRQEIIMRVTDETGRSLETVKKLLESVPGLVQKHTEKQLRVQEVQQWNLKHVPTDEFREEGVEKRIFSPVPENPNVRRNKAPKGLPPYLASLYDTPLLSREQERHLFRRLHFALFQTSQQLPEDINDVSQKEFEKAQPYMTLAIEDEQWIIRANMRLCVAIAKKHSGPDDFMELVSDLNMSLIKAIRFFDYSRGNKFSTYATWALRNNKSHGYAKEKKRRDRFRDGQELALEVATDHRSDEGAQLASYAQNKEVVSQLLSHLGKREAHILSLRFGLGSIAEPMTLKDIGEELGISKERVRQIQNRALRILGEVASENPEIQANILADADESNHLAKDDRIQSRNKTMTS